jgi:hypothetical protein
VRYNLQGESIYLVGEVILFDRKHPDHLIWQMHGGVSRNKELSYISNGGVDVSGEIFLGKGCNNQKYRENY